MGLKAMKHFFKRDGFSLVEVIIVAGILGGLSLTIVHITKEIQGGKRELANVQDQFQFQKEVSLILASKKHCTASIVWTSADGTTLGTTETFDKADIDDYMATPSQSRPIELWRGDNNNARIASSKKFSAVDTAHNTFGKLTINSLALAVDPLSDDMGNIYAEITKKKLGKQQKVVLKFPLSLDITTDSVTNKSTLVSCEAVVGTDVTCFKVGHNSIFAGCDAGNNRETASLPGSYQGRTLNDLQANNTFLGFKAGLHNSWLATGRTLASLEATRNTFVGSHSGFSNRKGYQNTFLGRAAGYSNTTGHNNVLIGHDAGHLSTTGQYNVFLGSNTGHDNTTGHENVFLGPSVGPKNTTGNFNVFIGSGAGDKNTTGDENTFVGTYAGYNNTTASWNTFLGHNAGNANTTGAYNTFLGYKAGNKNTTGKHNTFIGYNAGASTTEGSYNTFIGKDAGGSNTKGHSNTFIGRSTGGANTEGANNVYIGRNSGAFGITASHNTFVGTGSGIRATGTGNVIVGNKAGNAITTGEYNTVLGYKAGSNITTGKANICIGPRACSRYSGGAWAGYVLGGSWSGTSPTIHHNIHISTKTRETGIRGTSTSNVNHIAYYSQPQAPGSGNIVLGGPEEEDFFTTRSNAFAVNNIIEGDFFNKWVLIKDDLKVRRDLEVGGGIRMEGTIESPMVLASVSTPSDAHLKEGVEELLGQDSLEKILRLEGVRYRYKENAALPGGVRLGFIAQDVQGVLPEVVHENDEGMLSLNYLELIPLLVESVNKLHQENRELRDQLSKLEEESSQ